MTDPHIYRWSNKLVLFGIGILILAYLAALGFHLPQQATHMIVAAQGDHHATNQSHKETSEKLTEIKIETPPPLWMVLPFALMLGVIAAFPLLPCIGFISRRCWLWSCWAITSGCTTSPSKAIGRCIT